MFESASPQDAKRILETIVRYFDQGPERIEHKSFVEDIVQLSSYSGQHQPSKLPLAHLTAVQTLEFARIRAQLIGEIEVKISNGNLDSFLSDKTKELGHRIFVARLDSNPNGLRAYFAILRSLRQLAEAEKPSSASAR